MAIRRSPKFRFDYFMRSLPIEMIGKRCETLMRFALKEVDHLEKLIREADGVSMDASAGSVDFPPIPLPRFKEMKKLMLDKAREEMESQQRALTEKVESLEKQIQDIQDTLKNLSNESQNGVEAVSPQYALVAPRSTSDDVKPNKAPKLKESRKESPPPTEYDESKGAVCPTGEFEEFPEYDGSFPPKEAKKAFAIFCNHNRKQIKTTLDEAQRKNKDAVNELLKDMFIKLSDEDKRFWREWATWEKKRYQRDCDIYEGLSVGQSIQSSNDRKRRTSDTVQDDHISKKKKKTT
jgi:SWI/SNF-related matrix-associated actin-dependent regulator of chromatin subfamily A member 5